jgi:hypothetical protein
MFTKGPPTSCSFLKNQLEKCDQITFNVDLHHDPIRVEEGFDAKRDGFIAFKGRYFELMGG